MDAVGRTLLKSRTARFFETVPRGWPPSTASVRTIYKYVETNSDGVRILPRDAMLARCMLSSCGRLLFCLSVCLSHAGIVPKRLNPGSRKQRRTIAQGLWFSGAEDLAKIPTGSFQTGALNRGRLC